MLNYCDETCMFLCVLFRIKIINKIINKSCLSITWFRSKLSHITIFIKHLFIRHLTASSSFKLKLFVLVALLVRIFLSQSLRYTSQFSLFTRCAPLSAMKRGTKDTSLSPDKLASPSAKVIKEDNDEIADAEATGTKKPRLERPMFPRDVFPRTSSPSEADSLLKIMSWNVAGLRTLIKNNGDNVADFLQSESPDVVFLQVLIYLCLY